MSDLLPDPLEDFLHGTFDRAADERLRQTVLEKTSRVLRRRRLLRKLSFAAGLAACFVAGVAVGSRLLETSPGVPAPVHAVLPEKEVESTPAVPVGNEAVAHEWKAFDAQQDRAAIYFEAGRKYVRENQDYDSALRCYRQALDVAPPEALAIGPEDDWLLITLKQARRKDNQNANLN